MKLILNKKRDVSSSCVFDLKKKSVLKLLDHTVYDHLTSFGNFPIMVDNQIPGPWIGRGEPTELDLLPAKSQSYFM